MKIRKHGNTKTIYRSCLAILLIFASAGPAYSGIFVKWSGDIVKGESLIKGYEGQIEISAISGDFQLNNCGGFFIEKELDRSSAQLIALAFSGDNSTEVVINLTNDGQKGPEKYFKITLKNVIVQEVSTSVVDGDRPIEDVSLGADTAVFERYAISEATGEISLDTTTTIDCSGRR